MARVCCVRLRPGAIAKGLRRARNVGPSSFSEFLCKKMIIQGGFVRPVKAFGLRRVLSQLRAAIISVNYLEASVNRHRMLFMIGQLKWQGSARFTQLHFPPYLFVFNPTWHCNVKRLKVATRFTYLACNQLLPARSSVPEDSFLFEDVPAMQRLKVVVWSY